MYVTIDNVTAHGLRPPELRCFNIPPEYIQFFYWMRPKVKPQTLISGHRVSITEQLVSQDACLSAWIDGMERQVFVRKAAIDTILARYSITLSQPLRMIFHALHYSLQGRFHDSLQEEAEKPFIVQLSRHEHFQGLFLTSKDQDTKLPLPVIIPVKPNQAQKFLISLILSLGQFNNEIELWQARSLSEVFYNAGLIPVHPSECLILQSVFQLKLK